MSSTSAYTPVVIHTTYHLSESHRMYAVARLTYLMGIPDNVGS